ncbi:phosphoribosylformylglycinamidine cyclo-ligase [Candidatus Micrarchaeota archaeon]|nr:phosphoribosylformylglycinamidine cyclo-ligase [Candidatus Micrarchaeota archaeon]
MPYTYARAGVNVQRVKGIQRDTQRQLASTLNRDVILSAGHYSALVNIQGKKIAVHTDGVGTKVLVAQQLGTYDTVGIDAIAMNVNDLACIGAKPITVVDYLALQKPDPALIREIMKGLVKGAKKANVSIVGGETAITPDLIKGINGNGFDLSATCVGIVEKKLITGKDIRENDVLVGMASTGLHSNGYTLARKVLLKGKNRSNKKLMKEMLKPTRIYSPAALEMAEKVRVHGFAHITGGAFSKLTRVLPKKLGVVLDRMPTPPRLFNTIQRNAHLGKREMYRTFNMGIGFCVWVASKQVKRTLAISRKHGIPAQVIGRVIKGHRILLHDKGYVYDLT